MGHCTCRADEKQINLVGFMVGNGLADVRLDNLGALEYWASHALISYETKDKAIEACNLSHTGPLQAAPEPAANLVSPQYSHVSRLTQGWWFTDVSFLDWMHILLLSIGVGGKVPMSAVALRLCYVVCV